MSHSCVSFRPPTLNLAGILAQVGSTGRTAHIPLSSKHFKRISTV